MVIVRSIPNWAMFPWGITDCLQREGFQARWHLLGAEDRLFENLRDQLATIVMIGEPLKFQNQKYVGWAHVKSLYAYEPSTGFAVVDPGYLKNSDHLWESQGIFWQTEDDFSRLWKNMWRLFIEVSF